jgi:hypothetical protein
MVSLGAMEEVPSAEIFGFFGTLTPIVKIGLRNEFDLNVSLNYGMVVYTIN